MYEVIFDIEDPMFPTAVTREFETHEQAVDFAESLKEYDHYTNVQITSREVEGWNKKRTY